MIWAGINRILIDEATEQLEELGYNVLSSDGKRFTLRALSIALC